MRVNETADRYDAVRLDSCETINRGELKLADEDTGHVVWIDSTGNAREITLGPHAIKIRLKHEYHRP